MLWSILIGICAVALVILCLYVYIEFFASYEVRTGYCAVNNLTIAYRIAPRRQTSVDPKLKKSLNSCSELKGINVCYALGKSCTNGVKPEVTKKRCVVYAVGIVLSERGSAVDAKDCLMMKQLGYSVYTFPHITHAVTACYSIGYLLTINSAVQRVCPVVDKIIATHNLCAYPRFEVFSRQGIQIIVPLTRQICYFVPEVVPLSPYEWYLHSVRPLGEKPEDEE